MVDLTSGPGPQTYWRTAGFSFRLSWQSATAVQVSFEVDTIASATLGDQYAGKGISDQVNAQEEAVGVVVAG